MSVLYFNDFESGNTTNWTGTITSDFSVSPTHSIKNTSLSLFYQAETSGVKNISLSVKCDDAPTQNATLRYYDQANVVHVLQNVPCDNIWKNYTLTVNDYVKRIGLFNPPAFELNKYIDDLVLSDATAPPAPISSFPAQGAAVVTGIGSSLADVMLPVLPIVFGFVLVSFVVVWAFNRLVAFFRRS